MNKVRLGQSGIEASALIMGSDVLGSKLDRATTFRLLDYYADHGGTMIDTANFYASWIPGCHGGESETAIGAWIKERGNRFTLVAECTDRLLVDGEGLEFAAPAV